MLPVIVIVGRPNVGKSTLFNRLTRRRDALVANQPGLTRDRNYGYAEHQGRSFVLVDTGGIGDVLEANEPQADKTMADLVTGQTMQAASEAQAIIWLLDGRAGITTADEAVAMQLRRMTAPVYLAVNKTDGLDASLAVAECYGCGGFNDPLPISAEHGDGVDALISNILAQLPVDEGQTHIQHEGVKIAVIGRPNVGKSTLVNRMLGEQRMLVLDTPGATRDRIACPFQRKGKAYVLIDTAGVRRRSRIVDRIEKFSVIKSLQAIELAEIIILLVDARDGITDQDQRLLGLINTAGKSLIIAINKCDGITSEQQQGITQQFRRKLGFAEHACVHRISARHGAGVGGLFHSVDDINRSVKRQFNSAYLTALLYECLRANPPPLRQGRRIKLRYAHIGGHDPLRIIIHGKQTEHVPQNYQRYLANQLRQKLRLIGTPVLIEFKHSENPYKTRRNTPKQARHRGRIMRRGRK